MFTHLHVHTQYSLLDGACRPGVLAARAKELGMTSLAVTDHGNMYGAVAFYRACLKEGIKPIIGCEVYVAPRSRFDKDKALDKQYHHLILLVKNETGYKNLIKMVSLGWTEGFYFKPRIDRDLLEKHSEGLICLSACLAGEIPRLLLQRDYAGAKREALWYASVFGEGNYYLELQNHGIDEQRVVLDGLARLHEDTGIPLVATNDVHYVNKEDADIQQVLICIATNKTLGEDTGLEFHSKNFYLKSEEEMRAIFADYPDAIENTQRIADACNYEFEFGHTRLPFFETPGGMDHFEYFRSLCYKGLYKRYDKETAESYTDRLEYELKTVNQMGYTDYYLIVWDYVRFAKSKGIPVGPGRGSGAGSLAAYCIGITDLDPMRYGLIFERFLNPERVSMPDFDIDFCYERRQEVIDYVTEKYGAEHVSQIVTFGTLKTRAAIRDVGRTLGMPYAAVDAVAKLVPNDFHISIEGALQKSAELRMLTETNDSVRNLMEIARKIEGMPRNTSTHAAGVVITHDPVASYVPLATNDGVPVTQYEKGELEELGLLKMDFLGLRTLTVIDDAAKAVGVDIRTIPIDDPEVYAIFASGKTEGIFQFESGGMKNTLMRLVPTKLEDLIAATSLYRPGPASQIDTYIENSRHPEKVTYDTPLLEPILRETYGCIVYQEQVMQIFRSLAGYSFGRADVVRRNMAKKKHAEMERERTDFLEGCAKNGIALQVATAIFDRMDAFASYAFNKSHAACYALIAYQCAWLKRYYPAQFMAALLTSVLDDTNKVARYIAECKRLGLRLAPPDINTSMKGFTASGNTVNYGLLGIKNLGAEFINEILKEREKGAFKDVFDFCERMLGGRFNRRAAESLVRCGAMDGFGANRRQMLQALPTLVANLEEERKKTMYGQVGFFDLSEDFGTRFELPAVEEFSKTELLAMEKEMTGLYLSGHPIDKYEAYISAHGCARTFEILEVGTDGAPYNDRDTVTLCGIVTHITVKQTKRDKSDMAIVTLEDLYGSVEVLFFPRTYEKYREVLTRGAVLSVTGTVSVEEEKDTKLLASVVAKPGEEEAPRGEKNTPSVKPSGRAGLYLKLPSESDSRLKRVRAITAVFDGGFPLYLYFEDEGKYHRQPKSEWVDINETMLAELKRLLGENNVVVMN